MITHDYLLSIIHYDPDTGIMTWKPRPRISVAGQPVKFRQHHDGFNRVRIEKHDYRLHRLTFFYMTGRWVERVRNLSGDKNDNRWCNLAEWGWEQERQTNAEARAQEKAAREKLRREARAERERIKQEQAERKKEERESRRLAAQERKRQARKAYNKANPHLKRAAKSRRRAALRQATTPTADTKEINRIYALREIVETINGVAYHVDHVIPLAKNGLHHQENLVVMRHDFNVAKSDQIIPAIIRFFTPYDVPEDK